MAHPGCKNQQMSWVKWNKGSTQQKLGQLQEPIIGRLHRGQAKSLNFFSPVFFLTIIRLFTFDKGFVFQRQMSNSQSLKLSAVARKSNCRKQYISQSYEACYPISQNVLFLILQWVTTKSSMSYTFKIYVMIHK